MPHELRTFLNQSHGKFQEQMPVLFLGHGNPMNALQTNEFTESWALLGELLPVPKAILCVSAHWETSGTCVTAMPNPSTIHDFGGFPQELFNLEYPAPGSPDLAHAICNLLAPKSVQLDYAWGLDHGSWSILKHMYPQAQIPVVQLSLDYNLTPDEHYQLAMKLSILRNQGVLILGSGNLIHNLRLINWHDATYAHTWAIDAERIFNQLLLSNNHHGLLNYPALGQAIGNAVPTSEHIIPLFYVLALQQPSDTVVLFNQAIRMGSLSMTSVLIG